MRHCLHATGNGAASHAQHSSVHDAQALTCCRCSLCVSLPQRVLAGCHDTYGAGYLDAAQLAAFLAHAVQQLADPEAVQRHLPLSSYASIAAAKVALLLGKGGR